METEHAGCAPCRGVPETERGPAVFWRNRTTALLDRIPLPIAYCDGEGTILAANPAMAAEWGALPGQLRNRSILDLFHPRTQPRLRTIAEAVRMRRRSRYELEVLWATASGAAKHGTMTVDLVSDAPDASPDLLLILRPADESPAAPAAGAGGRLTADPLETKILALAAGGTTTPRIASAVGLTADGVNYHLKQLSLRWGVTGKTALVARAYAEDILAAGTWPPALSDTTPA